MGEKEAFKYLAWLCIGRCPPFTKQMDERVGRLLWMRGGAIEGSTVFARHFVLRERGSKNRLDRQYNPPVLPFLYVLSGALSHLMQVSLLQISLSLTFCVAHHVDPKEMRTLVCGVFRCRRTSAWTPSTRLCREWPSPSTGTPLMHSNATKTK